MQLAVSSGRENWLVDLKLEEKADVVFLKLWPFWMVLTWDCVRVRDIQVYEGCVEAVASVSPSLFFMQNYKFSIALSVCITLYNMKTSFGARTI